MLVTDTNDKTVERVEQGQITPMCSLILLYDLRNSRSRSDDGSKYQDKG